MAEEFQAGICSGNWWNSSRRVLSTGLSPCSLAINNDIGGCYSPWQTDMADHHLKVARSCAEESNLVSDNRTMVFPDVHAPNPSTTPSSTGRCSNLDYSNLQMMGYGLLPSSTSSNWNPSLLCCGGGTSSESNIHSMVEENMDAKLEYRREGSMNGSRVQKEDWNMETSFSSCANHISPIDPFKSIAHQEFALDQQSCVSTVTSAGTPSSIAGQDSTSGFPLASTISYGSYNIQSLFDADPQPQHSVFNNQSSNYSPTATYATKESSATWSSKFPSFLKPSAPKQQTSGLVFANNTPYWNASASALSDIRSNIFNSPNSSYVLPNEDKPNCSTSITKSKPEEVRQDTESVLKKSTACEPEIKRPRIETPSPLPTFKVRKEKLGDRITCLQQLVSPFGKTDTASVLHEAIEYIKFLHAQVNNLSAPYMKSAGIPFQHPQDTVALKEMDDSKDLRSRGLCLVQISSTFPVANETTADFWTPSFGSTFR